MLSVQFGKIRGALKLRILGNLQLCLISVSRGIVIKTFALAASALHGIAVSLSFYAERYEILQNIAKLLEQIVSD
jgi:hypothetical protein